MMYIIYIYVTVYNHIYIYYIYTIIYIYINTIIFYLWWVTVFTPQKKHHPSVASKRCENRPSFDISADHGAVSPLGGGTSRTKWHVKY